jgi:hypothetical protein
LDGGFEVRQRTAPFVVVYGEPHYIALNYSASRRILQASFTHASPKSRKL